MGVQRTYIFVLGAIALGGIIGVVVIAIKAPGVNTGGIYAVAGAAVGALATMALAMLGKGEPNGSVPYVRYPPPMRRPPQTDEPTPVPGIHDEPTEPHTLKWPLQQQ